MEGMTLQTDFERLEKKIIQLIEGYKALKARNEDLTNELRIQGREVEELKRKVQEFSETKNIISRKVDDLLGKVQELDIQ